MATTLSRPKIDVNSLDPYAFMAVLGKRVIHPGGRRSTEELFDLAHLQVGQKALDVGCGVGTTAIQMARRFGAVVTAIDISPQTNWSGSAGRAGWCWPPSFSGASRPPKKHVKSSSGRCVRACSSTSSTAGCAYIRMQASRPSRSDPG